MKVLRILIVAVTLAIAAFTQLHTQPVAETLTVDTLAYLGKIEAGEAGGALFLPDGNIIALWKSIPHVIDSKTGEVLRRLDTVHSSRVDCPKLSKDGTKLLAISMGPKLVIWDVVTGKLIQPPKDDLIDFCISPDGTKFYCTQKENKASKGAIYVYDMNTIMVIDTILKKGIVEASYIAISPDGQTLAVSVYKSPDSEYDKKTNQVILIDLKDKTKYTVLETFEPQVYSMEFSPDGKQIAFKYDNGNYFYIYLYNILTKEKKYIKGDDISNIFGATMAAFGKPDFIDNNTIIFGTVDYGDMYRYELIWNTQENKLKKMFKLMTLSIDIKDSTILLCNQRGVIAFLNKNIVPVKDIVIQEENYLKYSNNQLEYISNNAYIGESQIYDTTGKNIGNLDSQQFNKGKNLIRLNQNLPNGVYILTINNGTELTSYKFIVE